MTNYKNIEQLEEEARDLYKMIRRSEDGSDMFKANKKTKNEWEIERHRLLEEIEKQKGGN